MSRLHKEAPAASTHRAFPFVLLLVGIFCYIVRATDWFRAVPGDLGDARFNSVILEHLFQWIRGDAPSLWTPSFFFPARGTLAFSDNHFGSGPVYVLFRSIGMSRELAFDAWFATGCLLNFAAMYAAMRRLQFNAFAASVAAFIFTFSLPALAQEGHAQLTYRFALPMAYVAFLQFAETRRLQELARVAAWGALQFFCSIYLGVFTVYLIAATAVAMTVPGLRPVRTTTANETTGKRGWVVPTFVILACGVATAALLLKYHSISRSYGFARAASEILVMLPRPQSYLLADGSTAYPWLRALGSQIPVRHEHQMFPGLVPVILSLCALLAAGFSSNAHRRQLLGRSLVALALLVAMTLYVGDRSIYQLLMNLPGVSSIRAVSRVILIMMLPVAIMAAIGVESLQRVRPAKWIAPIAIAVALALELLAYQTGSTPFAAWRSRLEPLSAALERAPRSADPVLYVTGRTQEPFFLTELDGMVFAQDQKLPTLNGYSGNAPPNYIPPFPCTPPAARIYALAGSVLARAGHTQEEVLSRAQWIQLEPCPSQHVATDAAPEPPSEDQAKNIKLDATVTRSGPNELRVLLRIRNNGSSTLHTLSRVGHPLRLSWRFVRAPATATLADPPWDGRHDAYLSIPPGGEEEIPVLLQEPASPGSYELQFSIVAEGYEWLHNLKMPIARVSSESLASHETAK